MSSDMYFRLDSDVSDRLTKAGFARSMRTGREILGVPEFSEGFLVSPNAVDAVSVMHLMSAKERPEDSDSIRSMLDKYREVLVEDGMAVELRERPLVPLMLIVKMGEGA